MRSRCAQQTWRFSIAQKFSAVARSLSDGDRLATEKHLRLHLGALSLPQASTRIDEVLAIAEKKLKPKSVNNLRVFVQTVFAKAIRRQVWNGANPVDAVPVRKVPRIPPNYLKPEEVKAVLAEVPAQWRPLFACAVYTGMRRGELVALQKSDVDLVPRHRGFDRFAQHGQSLGGDK